MASDLSCLHPDPPSESEVARVNKVSNKASVHEKEAAKTAFASAFELYQQSEFDAALRLFGIGLTTMPDSALAHFYTGEILYRQHRVLEARKEWHWAEALAPTVKERTLAQSRLSVTAAEVDSLLVQIPSEILASLRHLEESWHLPEVRHTTIEDSRGDVVRTCVVTPICGGIVNSKCSWTTAARQLRVLEDLSYRRLLPIATKVPDQQSFSLSDSGIEASGDVALDDPSLKLAWRTGSGFATCKRVATANAAEVFPELKGRALLFDCERDNYRWRNALLVDEGIGLTLKAGDT